MTDDDLIDTIDTIIDKLRELTPEQRVLAFQEMSNWFCRGCGRPQPEDVRGCQCSNDE